MLNIRRLFFSKKIDTIGGYNLDNRNNWIKKALEALPEGGHILDAGAGEMPYKKYCSHLQYTSQDFCEYDGLGDNKGLQAQTFNTSKIDIVSDIASMPVDAEIFDAVLCSEVLEHIKDPVRVVNELIRVLKPGGFLIITAPFCSLTHFAPYHFATGFNRYFYEQFSNQLQIVDLQPSGNYFEYLAQEVKRASWVAKYYENKKETIIDRFRTFAFLNVLTRYNTSNASSELLCYGYHFLAKKNVN